MNHCNDLTRPRHLLKTLTAFICLDLHVFIFFLIFIKVRKGQLKIKEINKSSRNDKYKHVNGFRFCSAKISPTRVSWSLLNTYTLIRIARMHRSEICKSKSPKLHTMFKVYRNSIDSRMSNTGLELKNKFLNLILSQLLFKKIPTEIEHYKYLKNKAI